MSEPSSAGGNELSADAGPPARFAKVARGATAIIALVIAKWRVLITVPIFAVVLVFTAYIASAHKLFWDFAVYRAGVLTYLERGTPYDPQYLMSTYGVDLPFTYTPIVILAFASVAWLFTSPIGNSLLFALHLAACAAIPFLLVPKGQRSELLWMTSIALVAFGLSGTKLVLTGNVGAILMALALAALAYSVKRQSYLALWLALLVVCQIKIYLICLAAVPFLIDRKIIESVIASAIILSTFALNYLVSPDLFHQFNETLSNVVSLTGYVGTSVMTAVQVVLSKAHLSAGVVGKVALAAHGIYCLLLIGFAAAVLWARRAPDQHLALLWALMAALLISPRLAEYDMAIMVIPFLFFLRHLLERRDIGLVIALAGFVGAISLVRTPLADWGGLIVLLAVWMGVGISWLLSDGTPQGVRVS